MGLLLSGGGRTDDVTDFFIAKIDLEKTVLYIPVASEDMSYEDCLARFTEAYGPKGLGNVRMCVDPRSAVLDDRIGAVYIDGGNTFKLLKIIKETGFDEKIKAYLEQGGFVFGLSAGSIVFGNDILGTTYETENEVGLKDSRGLNLVKGFDICCHYGSGDEENTAYKRNRINARLTQSHGTIALPDGCAVFIEGNAISFLGEGIVLFTKD